MNNKPQQWHDLLECYYGVSLSDHQAVVWFNELPATNNAELCEAIRTAAAQNMKPIEYRATVRDLIQWLRISKAIKHREKKERQSESELESFKKYWKEKLERGASKDDFISAVYALNGLTVSDRNDICREVLGK